MSNESNEFPIRLGDAIDLIAIYCFAWKKEGIELSVTGFYDALVELRSLEDYEESQWFA